MMIAKPNRINQRCRRWRLLATVVSLIAAFGWLPAASAQSTVPINERPLYGGVKKTEELKAADRRFIAAVEKEGGRAAGARHFLKRGWEAIGWRQPGLAIRRFNQVWLLKPKSGEIYWGFAVAMSMRGDPVADTDTMFLAALAVNRKHKKRANLHFDYGLFLARQDRYRKAAAHLERAVAGAPKLVHAQNLLGRVYLKLGDRKRAAAQVRKIRAMGAKLDPVLVRAFPR